MIRSIPARLIRSNAFWGWCVLLLCTELLGVGLLQHQARMYDFRAFYAAGRLLWQSPRHLYDFAAQLQIQNHLISPSDFRVLFYHPGYEAIFFIPAAFLGYSTAYVLYVALNTLLLGAAFHVAPHSTAPPVSTWSRAILFFAFLPAIDVILQGQDSIVFFLICCVALRELQQQNDFTAGCILAFGIFRPQLAVPIAALIACSRGWRFLKGFGLVSSALGALSIAFLTRDSLLHFLQMIAEVAKGDSPIQPGELAASPHSMPNLCGLLYICGMRLLPRGIGFICLLALSIAIFCYCVWLIRKAKTIETAFSIAVLAALILSYHLYLYELTLLLIPILLLHGRGHKYIVVACYVLPYLLVLSGFGDWFSLVAPLPLLMLWTARDCVLPHATNKPAASIALVQG